MEPKNTSDPNSLDFNPNDEPKRKVIYTMTSGERLKAAKDLEEQKNKVSTMPSDDPSKRVVNFKNQRAETSILDKSGVAGALAEHAYDFTKQMADLQIKDWGSLTKDETLVNIVKENTRIQKTALDPATSSTIFIPEAKYSTKSQDSLFVKTEGSLMTDTSKPQRFYLDQEGNNLKVAPNQDESMKNSADDIIRRFEERNKEKIENFGAASPEVTTGEKEIDWDKVTLEPKSSVSPEVTAGERPIDSGAVTLVEPASSSSPEVKSGEKEIDWDKVTLEPKNSLRYKEYSPEEYQVIAQEYVQSIEKSNAKIEKIEDALETRKNKSKEGLLAMGLKGLSKGLESWKKVRPGYKIALAVTLAGASIATGGAWSIAAKGLSTLTFASDAFQKEYERKIKDGEDPNKATIAAKSLIKGLVLALGTSQLVSLAVEGLHSEVVSSTMDKIKDYLGFGSTPTAVPTPVVEPTVTSPGAYEVVSSGSLLPEYTIQPGDNLTKIFSEQVISTLPGADNLTNFQKENMIQNLLAQAAQNPGNPAFTAVNQFANPNLIYPGQIIDLESVKKLLTDSTGGQSLFERASLLQGSTAVTGGTGTTFDMNFLGTQTPAGVPEGGSGDGLLSPDATPENPDIKNPDIKNSDDTRILTA